MSTHQGSQRPRPTVVGEAAADRLMRSLDYRRNPSVEPLTREQVAVVLHALADHTAISAALTYRVDESSPWPQATSMGRWFHDVADDLEDSSVTAADGTALIGAIEKDLIEPLNHWMGDASDGARALVSRVRTTLIEHDGPSALVEHVTAALDAYVSPHRGVAAHGFDLVVSRVRAAITAYRMEQPR